MDYLDFNQDASSARRLWLVGWKSSFKFEDGIILRGEPLFLDVIR